ncbi:hypothetical protein AT730_25685 (plasmid) [Vibrio alginolyticus]|nr:hypothetical protein AT730_25685 [Vibrio alginolyticus]
MIRILFYFVFLHQIWECASLPLDSNRYAGMLKMNIEYKEMKWHSLLKLSREVVTNLEKCNADGEMIDKIRIHIHATKLLEAIASDLTKIE